MRIVNKYILSKLAYKNKGNPKLTKTIQELINDIEQGDWKKPLDLKNSRPDADCVYGGTFYFFNISIHRTLVLIEFEENGEATIVWAGSHDDYEMTFKNNRSIIKKWLRDHGWI